MNKYDSIKAYWGSEGKSPLIYNVDLRDKLIFQQHYSWVKDIHYNASSSRDADRVPVRSCRWW
jgi:hypothetical protein